MSRLLQATAPADPARSRSPLSPIPQRAPKAAASPTKTKCRALLSTRHLLFPKPCTLLTGAKLSPHALLAGVGFGEMSMAAASRRKNKSTPATLGAAATAAPSQTLGRGVGAAAAAGLSFARAHGVGLAPPTRSRGCGGGSATIPATTPFSIDGTFPSSSSASMVFPFPPSPTAVDDSSPGSWDNNLHPSGGFMSYFTSQPHNSHMVGAMNNPLPTNNVDSSPEQVDNILESENNITRTEKVMPFFVLKVMPEL
ncbi:unnamed protein product [Urochloa humidicola]